jgi:anti-sigma regulatory factor (Ser/Thr protein kinase)
VRPADLVRPARSARALLPPADNAPAAARRLVSTMLLAWGCVEQVEVAELVISELVSNAVQYAAEFGDLEIELAVDAATIHISVADGSTYLAQPRQIGKGDPDNSNSTGTRGLGLRLVERVARQWGVEEYVLGKRVWVELPLTPAAGDRR